MWVGCGCDLRRNTLGFVPGNRRYPSDEVTISILVGIGVVAATASTPNWLLCRVVLEETSWGNDVWQ